MEKISSSFFSETLLMRVLFYAVIVTCLFLVFAISSPSAILPAHASIDSIVVVKHQRLMHVFEKHNLLKTYHIALGEHPVGPKHFRGDMRTPEGLYCINAKNATSHYHKSLHISYPSQADRNYAHRYGKDPGGDVMIHGLPNGQGYIGEAHVLKDWTWGCIAITDQEIDEMFDHVAVGAQVNILP